MDLIRVDNIKNGCSIQGYYATLRGLMEELSNVRGYVYGLLNILLNPHI